MHTHTDGAQNVRTGVVAIVGLSVAHEVGEELGTGFARKDSVSTLLVGVVFDGTADLALDRPRILLFCLFGEGDTTDTAH